MTAPVNIDTAAAALGFRSVRGLKDWLARHPLDPQGEPFYSFHGRARVFYDADIARIRAAKREDDAAREAQNEAAKSNRGYVYFIKGGDFIKIGYSRSLKHRIIKMLTDVPFELHVLHLEPGTIQQEKVFHRQFAHIRVRGEWFHKTPELIAFIEQQKALRAGAASS